MSCPLLVDTPSTLHPSSVPSLTSDTDDTGHLKTVVPPLTAQQRTKASGIDPQPQEGTMKAEASEEEEEDDSEGPPNLDML